MQDARSLKIVILTIGLSSQFITDIKEKFSNVITITVDDDAERLLFDRSDNKFLFNGKNADFIQSKILTLVRTADFVISIIAECSFISHLTSVNLQLRAQNIPNTSFLIQHTSFMVNQITTIQNTATTMILDARITNAECCGFDSPLSLIHTACYQLVNIVKNEQIIDLDIQHIRTMLLNKAGNTDFIIGCGYSGKEAGTNALRSKIQSKTAHYDEAMLMFVVPQNNSVNEAEKSLWTIVDTLKPSIQLSWGLDLIDDINSPIIVIGFLKKYQGTPTQSRQQENSVIVSPPISHQPPHFQQIQTPISPQIINTKAENCYTANSLSPFQTEHLLNMINTNLANIPSQPELLQQSSFQRPENAVTKLVPQISQYTPPEKVNPLISNTINTQHESIYVFEEGGLTLAHFPGQYSCTSAEPEAITGLFEALKVMTSDVVGAPLDTVLAGNKKIKFKTTAIDNKRITGVSIYDRTHEDEPSIENRLGQSLNLVSHLFRQHIQEAEMKDYIDKLLVTTPLSLLFEYSNSGS